jgi:hypothetical protein
MAKVRPPELSETEKVVRWRAERFLELDLSPEHAAALAELDADWHRLKDLLDAGCDVATAVRIVT